MKKMAMRKENSIHILLERRLSNVMNLMVRDHFGRVSFVF